MNFHAKEFNPIEQVEAEAKSRNFRVVSLFSGCGGMDLGFKGDFDFLSNYYPSNPFDIIFANDYNEYACKTYSRNIGGEVKHGDIWLYIDEVPTDNVDVVIGGFPCQDISVNGKGLGVKGAKSGLYRAMVEVVRRVRPRVFVAENVKGLLMKHNVDSLRKVLNDFSDLGYKVSYHLYQCADYGVPQTRERVFIVGTLPSEKEFIVPKPTMNSETWITAKQAINDLKDIQSDHDFSHIWSLAKKSPDQGSRRLKADRPGYTMRAECHGNIQFHYELDRRMSMREAARIQSFPDEFIFTSKLRETERQIGNAVPPVMAWHIARSVAAVLK